MRVDAPSIISFTYASAFLPVPADRCDNYGFIVWLRRELREEEEIASGQAVAGLR